jgi:cytochrome bd-type quinol oxidase subunit 2
MFYALVSYLADATSAINTGVDQACGTSCNKTNVGAIFAGVANALIFVVGAVSVIMIIIGGLRYVLSNGDSKQAESARNTILYSVIGIVVAIASFAIVSFVTTHIK